MSRKWTGKGRATDHRGDRAEVVRQALLAAGLEGPERSTACPADVRTDDGRSRYVWRTWDPLHREGSMSLHRTVLTRSITEATPLEA